MLTPFSVKKSHQTEHEKGKDYPQYAPSTCVLYKMARKRLYPSGALDFRKESFESLNKELALFSLRYNFIIFGDFKVSFVVICDVLWCFWFQTSQNKAYVLQKSWKPSWIDLMLQTIHTIFKILVFETGPSGFHRITVNMMKISFRKFQPE